MGSSLAIMVSCFSPALGAEGGLQPGQCRALPETKTYLSDPLRGALVPFRCNYQCQTLNQTEVVIGYHVFDRRFGRDEMSDLVCEGVTIELKKSPQGFVLEQKIHVAKLWAIMSPTKELATWAKSNELGLSSEEFSVRQASFQRTLQQVSVEILSSSPAPGSVMFEFAQGMAAITSSSEDGIKLLARLRHRADPLVFPLPDGISAQSLTPAEEMIFAMVRYHGSHLFLP